MVLIRNFLNKSTRHRAGIFSCEPSYLFHRSTQNILVSIDCWFCLAIGLIFLPLVRFSSGSEALYFSIVLCVTLIAAAWN